MGRVVPLGLRTHKPVHESECEIPTAQSWLECCEYVE